MPRLPNPEKNVYKCIWEEAYNKGYKLFDFSNKLNGASQSYTLKYGLQNYRRSVRIKKLHPSFISEWLRIQKCSIVTIDSEKFQIIKKC